MDESNDSPKPALIPLNELLEKSNLTNKEDKDADLDSDGEDTDRSSSMSRTESSDISTSKRSSPVRVYMYKVNYILIRIILHL